MDQVNRTLYIPLYGKALVSKMGIFRDPDAERIWESEGFPLKGRSRSRWLAYYMTIRGAVFDRWAERMCAAHPGAVVLHIGCGLDSRVSRVEHGENLWFDIDFPDVIAQRGRYFPESANTRMLGADIREDWLSALPDADTAIVVMEGVSMYLTPEERARLAAGLAARFPKVHLLMDCYSEFAAKASRYKNPINDVGVTRVWGMDDPALPGLSFLGAQDMAPEELIGRLPPRDRGLFRRLYAGKFARSLYRLWEYRT